jgi:predicted GH43/DUF377 family glycosyl hydrolase
LTSVHSTTIAYDNMPSSSSHSDGCSETPLFTRYRGNPILTRKDWPYPVNSVFNAGATLLKNGETLLLCRVEGCSGLSHLCAARSANGVDAWIIDPKPTLMASPHEFPEEIWGIEDPRITYVPELDKYAVAYTSFSRGGPGVSLAMTTDFQNFERFGVIMQPEDKDAALLPRRIGNYWALIHRPVTTLGAHMWISYSPDLHHWGSHKMGRVVGCEQDWPLLSANRNGQGLADDLPWRTQYRVGKYLSIGPGAFRSCKTGVMFAARRLLDVRPGSFI